MSVKQASLFSGVWHPLRNFAYCRIYLSGFVMYRLKISEHYTIYSIVLCLYTIYGIEKLYILRERWVKHHLFTGHKITVVLVV